MRGSIKSRCGAWALVFDLPPKNGKRRQKHVTVRGGTREDAQRELDRLISEAYGLGSLPPVSSLYRQRPQTPKRFVYVIGNSANRLVKIGRTGDVDARLKTLQCASPVQLSIVWQVEGTHLLETDLHRLCEQHRAHGEWFDFGDHDPVSFLKSLVDGRS